MRRTCLVLIWFLALAGCAPMASGRATATRMSESIPSATLAGGAEVATVSAYFPIGVFEDGNIIVGNLAKFATMIGDLQAHNLDSVMFTNNYATPDAALLGVSDRLGV